MIGLLLSEWNSPMWRDLVDCVLDHKDEIRRQPLLCHQLFLLYFKYLHTSPELVSNLKPIFDVHILKDYCLNYKQVKHSVMELEIVEILNQMHREGEIRICIDLEWVVTTDQNKDHLFVDDLIENGGIEFTVEQFVPYQCDLRLGDLCFEINGPRHYLRIVNPRY